MGKRRKARECALQALYTIDTAGHSADDALLHLRDNFGTEDPAVLGYAETLVRGVAEHLEDLDALLQAESPNWTLGRMSRVDRNILRVASFELKHCADVPHKVVINEAIEVAKRFGTEESGAFINGILDRVAQVTRQVTSQS